MADTGPTPLERFINGILPENPIYRQLLGMCPTLAVTNGVKPALTMAAATTFVMVCSNIITSLMRGVLKPHLRILVFTLTIATFVTIADKFLAAFLPTMSDTLGPYVPLIIVNCIIISRCEICASKQDIKTSTMDALGMGIGFCLALLSISIPRELLGTGGLALPGMTEPLMLLTENWPGWGILILPPGAFLTLGLLLATAQFISTKRAASAKAGA